MQTSLTPATFRRGSGQARPSRMWPEWQAFPWIGSSFAVPVLAEREHVASMAMASSVRRRGEPSGHRSLRITVAEQLVGRGVDIDAIKWDSYRLDDGRWAVTADYRSGDASRHASFFYDLRGRFSVAANDEARWLLGDQPMSRGAQRGRPRPVEESSEGDTEPTLVSDKRALAKAAHESARHRPADDEPGTRTSRPSRCHGCSVRWPMRPIRVRQALRPLTCRRLGRSTRCWAAMAIPRTHRGSTQA